MSMIHQLTVGHLDAEALQGCAAVALRPLDDGTVARVLAEFPGLKVERRDGYVIAPWHGREDADRGEAFAARLQALTGCLVADRRNGRIVEVGRTVSGWATGQIARSDSGEPVETANTPPATT